MWGKCRLCGVSGQLQSSHVIPAFIFKWLRSTSATGHIRFGETPNRRSQDGWKKYWLCSSCENQLSKSETAFAKQLFHPFVENRLSTAGYGPWLLKFCVSLSWRVLHAFDEIDLLDDYTEDERKCFYDAERVWREYLIGDRPHPGHFRQHIYMVGGISTASAEVAPNINSHIMRHVAADVVKNEDTHLVYTKLPKMFIFGVLRNDHTRDWKGTKVAANGGFIPSSQTVPQEFYRYLNNKALNTLRIQSSISQRQQEKIFSSLKSDPQKFLKSETLRAIELDADLVRTREEE